MRSVGKTKRRWRDDIVRQQGAVWTRTAKGRERWGTLAECYFLRGKDTAKSRTEQNREKLNGAQTTLTITSRLSRNFLYRFSPFHVWKVCDRWQNSWFFRESCQHRFAAMSAIAGNSHYFPVIGGIKQTPISGQGLC